mmetsp:Transcript_26448/g.67145  ORF Transcript_26448/g.67145 Transcript_26448/m.67145 type:complete len:456 (-) Transcript_26448:257-1624(-)
MRLATVAPVIPDGAVVSLADMRGVSLQQIDEILARPPPTRSPTPSAGVAHSPPHSPREAARSPPRSPREAIRSPPRSPRGLARSPSAPERRSSVGPEAGAVELPSTASLAAMRRALEMVEAQAAAGDTIDPQQALQQALQFEAAPFAADEVGAADGAAADGEEELAAALAPGIPFQVPRPVPAGRIADTPEASIADAAVAATTAHANIASKSRGSPTALDCTTDADLRPMSGGGKAVQRGRRWFPQRVRNWHGPAAAAAINILEVQRCHLHHEDDSSENDESRPFAACDGNAPSEGEGDWGFALRWSRPEDMSTVYAQIARDETAAGASDSLGAGTARRAATLSSFADASALAAAARRAATAFRRAPVEPTVDTGAASGSAASAAATTARKAMSLTHSRPASAASASAGSADGSKGLPPPPTVDAIKPAEHEGVPAPKPKHKRGHRRSLSTPAGQ